VSEASSMLSRDRLTHDRIWAAIDGLARRHGLSPSALARRAGLDATSFNRSKRVGPDGRRRWPSTESIAKVLDATGTDLTTFLTLPLSDATPDAMPRITTAWAGALGPAGLPEAPGEDFPFPGPDAGRCFAVAAEGDALAPAYRDGDLLVVSATEPVRPGDRVVLHLADGGWEAGELAQRSTRATYLAGAEPRRVANADLAWIARVLWVRLG
jgi:phage repressor protein C with HTH and peptisase S24 domain